MKRLRFIDDYCRVKETSLSTRLPCGSGERSTPLHKPVNGHMVKAHSVFSHALNMGLETALGGGGGGGGVLRRVFAVTSCMSDLFWDSWRGTDALRRFKIWKAATASPLREVVCVFLFARASARGTGRPKCASASARHETVLYYIILKSHTQATLSCHVILWQFPSRPAKSSKALPPL